MHRIAITTLALALGLVVAPRAEAQKSKVTICRSGLAVTAKGHHACDSYGGVDRNATKLARKNHRHDVRDGRRGSGDDRGVYNDGNRRGSNGEIRCADGTWTTNGMLGCIAHGGVDTRADGTWDRGRRDGRDGGEDCDDDDDDDDRGNGRGKHGKNKGHGKHDKHGDRDNDDNDHDRDDDDDL